MEPSGIRVIRYGKRDASFPIWNMSDLHILNKGCSMTHIEKDRDDIKNDPYSLFFVGGDYCDWICINDKKRFDADCLDEKVSVQDLTRLAAFASKKVIDIFTPIRSKCIGFLHGNHELSFMNRENQKDIHEKICSTLKVPNMRYSGIVDLYFCHTPGQKGVKMTVEYQQPMYWTARLRVFIHHGAGAAATAGGKLIRLKNFVDMTQDCDLIMMGHLHEALAKVFVRMTVDNTCSELKQKVIMGMATGSYLKIYTPECTSYGEIRGYTPTTIGSSRAIFNPLHRTLTIENRAENVGMGMNQ